MGGILVGRSYLGGILVGRSPVGGNLVGRSLVGGILFGLRFSVVVEFAAVEGFVDLVESPFKSGLNPITVCPLLKSPKFKPILGA